MNLREKIEELKVVISSVTEIMSSYDVNYEAFLGGSFLSDQFDLNSECAVIDIVILSDLDRDMMDKIEDILCEENEYYNIRLWSKGEGIPYVSSRARII